MMMIIDDNHHDNHNYYHFHLGFILNLGYLKLNCGVELIFIVIVIY